MICLFKTPMFFAQVRTKREYCPRPCAHVIARTVNFIAVFEEQPNQEPEFSWQPRRVESPSAK